MENQEIKEKKLAHIKEVIATIQMNSLDDSLVKDNKLYFSYKDKSYRSKMPSQKDISEAHRLKDQYYIKVVQSDVCLTKAQLTQILKEKQGVDITALEEERKLLQNSLQDAYLELALVHPDSKDRIEEYKDVIRDLESQFTALFIKITEYLQPAIENQLEKVYIEFLTTRCSEIQVATDEWSPVWKSDEEFQNENSNLTAECVKHMTFLLIKSNR